LKTKQKTGIKKSPRHSFTSKEIKFLTIDRKGCSHAEVQRLFNERFGSALSFHQIAKKIQTLEIHNARYHKYTPEEKQFIENNIAGRSYADLTHIFNLKFNCSINVSQIENYLHGNKLRNGRNNKLSVLNFKYLPIGSEIVNTDGTIRVKIAINPSVWRLKNLFIWESANGPIPKNHVVIFADRNKSNFSLDNLLLVSRKELMIMNRFGLISTDKELTRTGLLIAKTIMAVNGREREIKKGGVL
jgi:hypothetical protein